jgi:hypothetical protein
MMKRALVSGCAVIGLLTFVGVYGPRAQEPVEATEAVSAEGSPHLSGGVGKDEREQLEAAAKDYNLKLIFAQSSGAFVADIQVTITDAAGSTVVDATSNGPLFFAKLPAGDYRIEATYAGIAKNSSATVPGNGQSVLDFRW